MRGLGMPLVVGAVEEREFGHPQEAPLALAHRGATEVDAELAQHVTRRAPLVGNDEDQIGSIYKNPANALLFADHTASVVFGDIIPNARIDSSVTAVGLKGSSDSTVKGVPYLDVMASWKRPDSNIAWFAGAVSEAGLSFHAATSTTNPIFTISQQAFGGSGVFSIYLSGPASALVDLIVQDNV